MRDAARTRRKLLDAAAEEFAAHGIAGARVDRVVAAARSNKAQLYAYFGSKEGLFEVVLAEHVDAIVDAVPLDARDLPGYAVGLYDAYLARPELVRLATWARLERRPAGHLFPGQHAADSAKLASIAAAQRAGAVDPDLTPIDVLSLVTAMSLTWGPASPLVAAAADDAPAEHERRRTALATAVRRALCCAGAG